MGSAAGRHAYSLAALPLSLAAMLAVPAGRGGAVARRHEALARRLFGARSAGPTRAGRILGHALTSLPVNLLAFALAAGFWAVFLARGVLYPVFGAGNLEDSWGGPSLVGAWIVHFIQGPPLFVVVSLVLVPISRAQAGLLGLWFGDPADERR